ncbi:hypothetical protein TELCIR_16128, partial [Teladorsagia circumcincta]
MTRCRDDPPIAVVETEIQEDDEPTHLKCASCGNRFKSAWGLLCHLTEFHRMMLYKIDEEPDQSTSKE